MDIGELEVIQLTGLVDSLVRVHTGGVTVARNRGGRWSGDGCKALDSRLKLHRRVGYLYVQIADMR
jgi:hypothetical protein